MESLMNQFRLWTHRYVVGTLLGVVLGACQDDVTGPLRLLGREVLRTVEPDCANPPGQTVNAVTGWCTSEVEWLQSQIDNVTTTPAGCNTMKATLQGWMNNNQIRKLNRSVTDFQAAGETPIFGDILADSSLEFQQRQSSLLSPMRINIHENFGGYQSVKETMRHEFAHVYGNLNQSDPDEDIANSYIPMCFSNSTTYPPDNPTPAKRFEEVCTLEPVYRLSGRLTSTSDGVLADQQSCLDETQDYPGSGPEWINVCVDRYYVEQLWVGQVLIWEEETYLYTACYHVELGWLME